MDFNVYLLIVKLNLLLDGKSSHGIVFVWSDKLAPMITIEQRPCLAPEIQIMWEEQLVDPPIDFIKVFPVSQKIYFFGKPLLYSCLQFTVNFQSNSIFNICSPDNFSVLLTILEIEFGHVTWSDSVIFFGSLNNPP